MSTYYIPGSVLGSAGQDEQVMGPGRAACLEGLDGPHIIATEYDKCCSWGQYKKLHDNWLGDNRSEKLGSLESFSCKSVYLLKLQSQ